MRTATRLGFVAVLLSLAMPMLARADEPSPDHIVRFVSATKGSAWGKTVMILHVQMPPGGKLTDFVVPNQDPMGAYDPSHVVMDVMQGVKPGDYFSLRTHQFMGVTSVSEINKYDLKPGEDAPGSFLFEYSATQDNDATVTLSRFGQVGVLTVAMKKDAAGKNAPDPAILDAIKSFTKGDVVTATVRPGQPPVLESLELYTPPLTGKFVKIVSSDVDGQPHPAIEIKDGDNTTTVLLPGAMNKLGKWTPDPKLFATVHHMRANSSVAYHVTKDDQPVLKDIALAPTQETSAR